MIKKLLIALVLLIVLAVGATFLYLDSIVTSGIEVVGSEVLDTEVTVASVSISPLNGTGTISGLEIRNPEGFDAEYIFQLEQVEVNLNTSSLFSDVIEIDSVVITQPQITYETRITTDNVRALMENIGGGDSSTDPASESEGGKGIIVREFRMLDPQLNLVAAVVTAPVGLPDIELNDIGTEDNSATVAQAMEVVLSALRNAIVSSNLPGLDELREGVENRLQQGVEEVEEAVDDAVEELGTRLRNILPPN